MTNNQTFFMVNESSDILAEGGIRTPDALTYLDYKSSPIDLYGTSANVGVEGFEPPEFLMCQIYSLVPIHRLSSTPIWFLTRIIRWILFLADHLQLVWEQMESNHQGDVLQTRPVTLTILPKTEWHVFFKVKVWLFNLLKPFFCCRNRNRTCFFWFKVKHNKPLYDAAINLILCGYRGLYELVTVSSKCRSERTWTSKGLFIYHPAPNGDRCQLRAYTSIKSNTSKNIK